MRSLEWLEVRFLSSSLPPFLRPFILTRINTHFLLLSLLLTAETKTKDLSPFLTKVSETYSTLFVKKLQKISKKTREETAAVLGRPAPNEEEVQKTIDE
jgi:hypothetical protein